MSKITTLVNSTPEELTSKILSGIKPYLKELHEENNKPEPFIGVKEVAEIFQVSQNNIRKKCSDGQIPFYQESDKSPLRFKASEIHEYIVSGRVKTKYEIQEEAKEFVNSKKSQS